MSRRTPFVATLVALPIVLSGCGIGPAVVGIHPAPAETSGGAAVTQETAKSLSLRLLDEAHDVREKGAKASAEDRREVLSGPALRSAAAGAKSRGEQLHATGADKDLQVLAISRGSDWPRVVLSTSREKDVQFLHVFVATAATEPYTLFADVPMAAGSSVPALPPLPKGTPVTVTKKLPKDVAEATNAWAKGVAYPAPKKVPSGVSFDDAFSKALRKNAKAQDKDLGDLASYSQSQHLVDATTVGFELADGGYLTFLPMTRVDTVTAGRKTKELKIEDKATRRALDASKVRKRVRIRHAETLALVTPAEGKAKVVGVGDVLHSADGR